MKVRDWVTALAILLAIGAVGSADESDQDAVSQIRDHLAGFQLDTAEELLQLALQRYPNSDRLKSLHYSLYLANLQRADGNAAARHIIACVKHELERLGKDRVLPDNLAAFVRLMVSAHKETRTPQAAIRTIDDVRNTIESGANTEDRVVAELLQDLRLGKVSLLSYGGKVAAAKEILAKEHDRAKAALNKNPEDTQLVMQLAKVLAARVTLATDTASKSRPRVFREYLRFLDDQVRRHPNEANILRTFLAEYLQELSRLSRTKPDNAEQMLRRFEQILTEVKTKDPKLKASIESARQELAAIRRRIASTRRLMALVGKQSVPLEVDAWVGGEPLTQGDLNGKVMLLDFWAVWCRPCVAGLPHLRKLHDRYAEKGLVIIGITEYQSFGWDAEVSRARREEDLSHESEVAAMRKFLKHHQVNHRVAFVSKASDVIKYYRVAALPQYVVIDRQGTIRFVRVGAAEGYISELETVIRDALNIQGELPD